MRAVPVLSFIVQYYRHPRQRGIICERLRDPRVEVIVHADSNDEEDAAAFSAATTSCGALILHSNNVHEMVTGTHEYIVGAHPERPTADVVVCTGFSGDGFKFGILVRRPTTTTARSIALLCRSHRRHRTHHA